MTRLCGMLIVFFLMLAYPSLLIAQSSNPSAVIDEYWRYETRGGRLTPMGWRKAEKFFVTPSPMPSDPVIAVVGAYSVWPPKITGDRAQVTVGIEELCEFKRNGECSKTIFSEALKTGVLFKMTLVCDDSRARLGKQQSTVPCDKSWKIEGYGKDSVIWLRVDRAILYLEEKVRESKNKMFITNAAKTLKRLRMYVRTHPGY